MNELKTINILKLVFRTYFIRIFYNYRNLFGEGMCFCIFSSLACRPGSVKDEIISDQLKLFNTNEYLSGFAAGIILRNDQHKPQDTEKTRKILSSVTGSIGDRLIYRIVMPVIVLSALNIISADGFSGGIYSVSAVISLLVLFNIFSFCLRYYGVSSGYRNGLDSLKIFRSGTYFSIVRLLTAFRNLLAMLLVLNFFIYALRNNILLFFLK